MGGMGMGYDSGGFMTGGQGGDDGGAKTNSDKKVIPVNRTLEST